jgi:hypothetical protein
MKKLLIVLVPILLFNSCKTKEKRVVVDELIVFGTSGFCMKDSLNNIYPSGAMHYYDSIRLEYDSTRLDIRQYFEFKRDSFVKIAKRLPMEQTEYYNILPSDTIGFKQLINKTLLNKRFKAEYDFPDSFPMIYDGWHYTLYYKASDDTNFLINYFPECLPDSLSSLHDFVIGIIAKSSLTKTNEFQYNPMTVKEAKRLYKISPPPPIPSKTDREIKYIHP